MLSQATATFTECLGSVHVLFQMLSNLLNRKHLEDTSTEYHQNSHRHNVPISGVRLPPCGDSSIDSENPHEHFALYYLVCTGNKAIFRSGEAKGSIGIVTGEHARNLIHFESN